MAQKVQAKSITKKSKHKIRRTQSIQDVIKDSKSFLKSKPVSKVIFQTHEIEKKTTKLQKQQKKSPKKQEKKDQKKKKMPIQHKKQQQKQDAVEKEKKIKKKEMEEDQKEDQKNEQKNEKQDNKNEQKFVREDFIHTEELQEGLHEMDEYYNFKERYLGREGQFSHFKVLIGEFYSYQNTGPFKDTAGAELKKRGFSYDTEENFDKFIDKMMDYDIVWIICQSQQRTNQQQHKFLTVVEKFFKAKKGLYLWCDNEPFYIEANYILKKFFDGMEMKGNYYGMNIVKKGELGKGTFDENHSIGYGLNNLHEGDTICHPENIHKNFVNFAYNTNNEPLVSYAEANENHGRIIIDCGFTKLQKQYWQKTPGTHQYVSNANVWLTGIPM